MATRMTTADGLWSNSATWSGGLIPSAGDTVNFFHTVTYDTDDDTTAYNTLNLYSAGTLQWTGSATRQAIRVSSAINIYGGTLSGSSGTQIRMHAGGNGLRVQTTAGSNLTMIGSEANSSTTLISGCATGQGALSVANNSGFGSGDWVSIYNDTGIANNVRTDEVCQVHSTISSDTMLIRRMVCASVTLSQAFNSGQNTIYTNDDVRAFNQAPKIIVDNEVFTVASTNSTSKTITTVESATTNHSAGTVGYETGTDMVHTVGKKVSKLAATLAEAASSGNNYVDVGCAGGYKVDDELGVGGAIEGECEEKIIQSISPGGGSGGSDRIVFTTNLSYNHTIGGLVVKLNRDCVFIGSATDSISTTNAYIYAILTNVSRTINLRNFEMRYVGSGDTNVYSGCVLRSSSTGNSDKIVVSCVLRHTDKSGYNGLFGSYYCNYINMKNCVTFDTYYAFGTYSLGRFGYYTGCIAMSAELTGYVCDGTEGEGFFYNFAEGCYQGVSIYEMPYQTSTSPEYLAGFRYIRCNHVSQPFFFDDTGVGSMAVFRGSVNNCPACRITYMNTYASTGIVLHDIFSDDIWRTQAVLAGSVSNFDNTSWLYMQQIGICNNYQGIRGHKVIFYYYGFGETDEIVKFSSRNSWKFTPLRNHIDSLIGFYAICQGNIGEKISIRGYARKSSDFSGTGPGIYIKDALFNILASDVLSSASDTWGELKVEYTFTSNDRVLIWFGGYGAAGNFWVDSPQLNISNCYISTQVFENIWSKQNFLVDGCGVVLGGVTL